MKPQSMLFTIYGEYVRHYGGEIWVGSLTRLIGQFGLSEQAIRVAISRMVRQGWLVARRIGNRSYYSMTERGKKRLDEAAARIYKQYPSAWNGKWCIVSYNIPETKRELRDQLRKELAWLGFGMLAHSTWISPHDLASRMKEITESYALKDYVEIFTSEHVGWSDNKQLVEKCWNLDGINRAYQEFIRQYQSPYEKLKRKMENHDAISDSECFVEKTQFVHQYRKFLFIDPSLPEELLPDFWAGQEAHKLFEQYYALLNPGAVRFFLEVFEPAPDKKIVQK